MNKVYVVMYHYDDGQWPEDGGSTKEEFELFSTFDKAKGYMDNECDKCLANEWEELKGTNYLNTLAARSFYRDDEFISYVIKEMEVK